MSRHDAFEARVWRLAAMLTGDRRQASRVATATLASKIDVRSLSRDRLDRLIIIRAREQAGSRPRSMKEPRVSRTSRVGRRLDQLRLEHHASRGGGDPTAPGHLRPEKEAAKESPTSQTSSIFTGSAALLAGALAHLEPQQREAWILHEVDGRDMVGLARAMDCSRTAAATHLDKARSRVEAILDEQLETATLAMREQVARLDPAPFIASRRARRRRRRLRRLIAAVLLVAVSAAVAIAWRNLL